MYKAKYIIKRTKNSDGKISEYSAILKVEFRFEKEVPIINRLDVKKRIFLEYESYPLVQYLLEKEKLELTSDKRIFKDNNRIIKIKSIWGLGFDLEAKTTNTTNKRIPLEKIIDLDALNEFVLTGEA